MKRLYLLAPFLALTAFAGYYHHWNATSEVRCCRLPPAASRPPMPYAEYENRNGRREAEADIARGKLSLLRYGMPVHWHGEYAEVMARDHGVEVRGIAGCIVSEALVQYADAYNRVMEEQITRRFGDDVFAAAQRKAEALYTERHPAIPAKEL